MAKTYDTSYPRENAERLLGVKAGTLDLDELAFEMSLLNKDDPVSVRDINVRPIPHSKVYFRGKETGNAPYLARYR